MELLRFIQESKNKLTISVSFMRLVNMKFLWILFVLCSFSAFSQKEKPMNYRRFDERFIHFGFMLGGNTSSYSLFVKPEAYEKYGVESLTALFRVVNWEL